MILESWKPVFFSEQTQQPQNHHRHLLLGTYKSIKTYTQKATIRLLNHPTNQASKQASSWCQYQLFVYCLKLRHGTSLRAHLHVVRMLCMPVFMALSTVFHSINSTDNSVFSLCSSGLTSVLLVLSTIYLFTKVSLSPDVIPSG